MLSAETKSYIDRTLLIAVRTGVVLVLAMPLIVTRDTFFPFIVGKALYSRTIIEIIFGVWLVLAARNTAYRPVASRLLIAFAIYVAISLIAGFTGVSVQRSLWSTYERMQGIVDLGHWFAFVLIVTSVFRTSEAWRHLLSFNLLVSLVMALMGVALVLGRELPVYDFLDTGRRIGITLGNPTYIGAYMLVNALIGIGLLAQSFVERPVKGNVPATRRRRRRRRRRNEGFTESPLFWWRVFWSVTVALDLWMMFESGTRGAFIGLAGAMIAFTAGYILWGSLKQLKVAAVALVSGLGAFGLFLIVAADTSVVQRIAEENYLIRRAVSAGQGDRSVKDRWASLSYGLQGFTERPLLGWGPENYIVVWGRHYELEAEIGFTFDQAHNKPMEELATKGAFGLISYLSMWGFMLVIVFTRIRASGADRNILTLVIGSTMVGYFVQNLFLFDTPATLLQFVLLVGFAISLDTTYDGQTKDESAGAGWTTRAVGAVAERFGLRALPSLEVLGSRPVGWAGITVLVVSVAAAVYLMNVRVYNAASEVVLTAQRGITWQQRLDHFKESIDTFPPLGNYPRIALFAALADNWGTLSEAEAIIALDMVDRLALDIIETEPDWWRAYVDIARVYQSAAVIDPEHAETARTYVEIATALAPETRKVVSVRARQKEIEDGLRALTDSTSAESSP